MRGFQRPEMNKHKMNGHKAAAASKRTPPHLRNHQSALAAGKRIQMANNDADGYDQGLGAADNDADDAGQPQQPAFQKRAQVAPLPGPMQKPKKKQRSMFSMASGIPASKKSGKKSVLSPAQDDDMFFGG